MSGYRLRLFGGIVLEGPAGVIAGGAAQKRRLALLALLAAAPGRALTRDRLIGYLSPESKTEQARHLLSVAVYELRKALGEAIETRGDEVVLSRIVVTDLDLLEAARTAGDHAAAVAVVTGPFLDGFFLGDAEEFERWLDTERDRQARLHAADLERLAEMQEARGDTREAVVAWRRIATFDPYSGRIALRLMKALERAGDRAAALRHARVHETLLREEFGAEPDPEIVALAQRLRTEPGRHAIGAAAGEGPTPSVVPGAARSPPLIPDADPAATTVHAAVTAAHGADPVTRLPAGEASQSSGSRRLLPLKGATAVVGATVLLALSLWFVVPWRGPVLPASLAVLPFHDLSSDGSDQQRFADGLVEDLLNALQTLKGLRVIDRNSSFAFRGDIDVREVARHLGVTHVLTGSVRRAGARLMVNVRLANGDTRIGVWSGKYEPSASDMTDLIGMQEEIARAVASELQVQFGSSQGELVRFGTRDLEAWELYGEGRRLLQQREPAAMKEALAHFQAAAAKDSTYARAYVGMADVYHLLGAFNYGMMPPARAAELALREVRHALRLEPDLAEAHAVLGAIHFNHERNWTAAEASFKRALDLNPGLGQAWHWYSLFLFAQGRWEDARDAVARMRDYDPTSPVAAAASARAAYFQRNFEEAIAGYARVIARDSTFLTALLGLGLANVASGRTAAAVDAYERAVVLVPRGTPLVDGLLAHAYGVAGRSDRAREKLEELRAVAARGQYVPPEYFALVHLGLRDHDAALDELERALEQNSTGIVFLTIDPITDPLRDHPRFIELLRRADLPAVPSPASR